MKRVGGLFDQIHARENLVRAALDAARGKRDRSEVRAFFGNFEERMDQLGSQLREGSLLFGPYRVFEVKDTKRRVIHAPPFVDRVVHHAIVGPIRETLERGAIAQSFACRRGKGQHAALLQASAWTRRSRFYGKMDVRKFYDSVDHDVLRTLLARRFAERRLLSLLDSLLDSYTTAPGKGLPIGALTSQYFGNFYLDPFDRAMKTHGTASRYLRYMDDAVVWTDRARARDLRLLAQDTLTGLKLELKHGGEWNQCARGLPFLGFVLYPDRIRLDRNGRRRLRGKLGNLERQWRDGRLGERTLRDRAEALFAHALWADDKNWRREVLKWSRIETPSEDFWETLELPPRDARRFLEQSGGELPLQLSEQESARHPEQQSGLPGLFGSRRGDGLSPDDASSCAQLTFGWDESTGKPPAPPYIQKSMEMPSPMETGDAGALGKEGA